MSISHLFCLSCPVFPVSVFVFFCLPWGHLFRHVLLIVFSPVSFFRRVLSIIVSPFRCFPSFFASPFPCFVAFCVGSIRACFVGHNAAVFHLFPAISFLLSILACFVGHNVLALPCSLLFLLSIFRHVLVVTNVPVFFPPIRVGSIPAYFVCFVGRNVPGFSFSWRFCLLSIVMDGCDRLGRRFLERPSSKS